MGTVTVRLDDMVSGLAFPTDVVSAGDGTGRLFATEIAGTVRVIQDNGVLGTPLLDISGSTVLGSERGLTSVAFHPGFADSGSVGYRKFYTASAEASGTGTDHFGPSSHNNQSVIYEWQVSTTNPNVVDAAVSPREILRINQPRQEHNVNKIAFGPDGDFYIAVGDGGGGNNLSPNGQRTDTVFGSILRIDVDDTTGNGRYSIPSGNPFAGNTSGDVEEIYAYGFRNPFRFSFDSVTDDLYAGDVGQADIEEINLIQAGKNYGWNQKEGSFRYLGSGVGVTDDLSGLPDGFDGVDPIGQYDHDDGQAVVPGFVYHGSLLPELAGKYVFGDFSARRLFQMDLDTGFIEELSIHPGGVGLPPSRLLGFGQDDKGELFLFGDDGRVVSLVPEPTAFTLLALGGLIMVTRPGTGRSRGYERSIPGMP